MLKQINHSKAFLWLEIHWRKVFIPAVILLTALWIYKVYSISKFALVGADYGYYMSSAEQQYLFQNLYSEVVTPYPPIGIFYYLLTYSVGISEPGSIFLFNALVSMLVILISMIGFGAKKPWEICFFSLVSIFAFYDFRSYDVKLELVTTLFLSLALLAFFKFERYVITGICLALAVLTKQYALSYLAIFGLYQTITNWNNVQGNWLKKLFSLNNCLLLSGFLGTIFLFFLVLLWVDRWDYFIQANQYVMQKYGTRNLTKSIQFYFTTINKSNYFFFTVSFIALFIIERKRIFQSKVLFIIFWLTFGALHLYIKPNKDYLVMPYLGVAFTFYFLYSQLKNWKLQFLFVSILFLVVVKRNKMNPYYIDPKSREKTMGIVDHFKYVSGSKNLMNAAMPFYSYGLHVSPQKNFSYEFIDNLSENRFQNSVQHVDSVLYDGYFEKKGIYQEVALKTRLLSNGLVPVDSFQETFLFVRKPH